MTDWLESFHHMLCSENMDLNKAIAELRQERRQVDEAILMLTRLAAGQGKRRGRPPKWLAETTTKRRGRPRKNPADETTPRRRGNVMSKAARKAQSERMKAYWTARRKAKA